MHPQIIWRGTDFNFLDCLADLHLHWGLYPDRLADLVAANMGLQEEADGLPLELTPEGVSQALMSIYRNLGPRWKAVALSHQSRIDGAVVLEDKMRVWRDKWWNNPGKLDELREERTKIPPPVEPEALLQPPLLPWIDARFITKHRTNEDRRWMQFLQAGADIADFQGDKQSFAAKKTSQEMAVHKYHLDIGGGGGTTWTGTYQKLALPGVLLHHETPSYDWYHEDLVPWVHYIPVKTDLADLRERYDWAQSHVEESFRISQRGTEFIRQMTTPAYWDKMYKRIFVDRVERTMMSYTAGGVGGKSENDFVAAAREMGVNLKRLGSCSGIGPDSCEWEELEVECTLVEGGKKKCVHTT